MWKAVLAACNLLILSACSSFDLEDYEGDEPELVLEEFFDGKVMAWGLFENRAGAPQQRFVVEIDGTWDGETLTLDEDFTYASGRKDRRVWEFTKTGENTWRGEAGDTTVAAQGRQVGSIFRMNYKADIAMEDGDTIELAFDDRLILIDETRMINRAIVKKFGIRVGEVSIAFEKVEG
jgi:hypothetical protein